MKNLFEDLLARLKASNGPTRIVMGVGLLLITLLAGYSVWRGRNPHMAFFLSDLDNAEFSAVTSALGRADIRFNVSTGGAPYTVWVDDSKRFEANSAIAQQSALKSGPRGIDTNSGSSAFDASIERIQKVRKTYWQEVEQSLESMDWIVTARVNAFFSDRIQLGRREQPTVAVSLRTSVVHPDPAQAQAAANLVQTSFSTDPANITIVDQHGVTLFDGKRDESLNEILEFERAFDREQTYRVQAMLDDAYGEGLAQATVRGAWTYERTESIDESLDPKKAVVSETISESSTPGLVAAGGPAGVQENLTIAQNPGSGANDPATRNDTERQYTYGTRMTHRVQSQPALSSLSVSLVLDASLEDQLGNVEGLVKAAVGFNTERGDQFAGHVTALPGIERDEEGNPIPPKALEPLEKPNPWISLGLQHGVEILAALVFFIVLLRSLKGGDKALKQVTIEPARKGGKGGNSKAGSGGDAEPEEPVELDPEVLARMQIEELIESDPERVSALLSRWAMGDNYYAESGA